MGQTPDLSFLDKESEIKSTPAETVKVLGYTQETDLSSVFAGVDLTTGSKSVVDAVAAGKTAAESIDRFIQGRSLIREDPYSPFVKMVRPSALADPSETTF